MNSNDRISKIIEYSGLTSSEFADKIEVQRSSISHITSGRNKPSLDFLVKVKDHFPQLQWDWLIKGEGEMLENKANNERLSVSKPTSLPDLLSMIDDDNFGVTESEDRIKKDIPREFPISEHRAENTFLNDSQRLEVQENKKELQHIENQENKIKKIVFFYESGKFESFEP